MSHLYAYHGHEGLIAAVAPRLEKAGFKRTADAESADMVLTFCTSQTALEDLYFGEGGLVTAVRPGAVLVDFSATTPGFAREMNAVATVNDLVMVEAPLSVNSLVAPAAFSQENLTVFAASESDDVSMAEKALGAIAATVVRAQDPGTAQLLRAERSLSLASELTGAIEADALAHAVRRSVGAMGLSMEESAIADVQENEVLAAVREERFDGAYTVEMLLADLSATLMAADDAELILPQAESVMHLLELLAVIGGADMAPAALALVYRENTAGAEHGLDWSRAEQTYGGSSAEDDDDWIDEFDESHECGCGGHHDHDRGFDDGYDSDDFDGFSFSAN